MLKWNSAQPSKDAIGMLILRRTSVCCREMWYCSYRVMCDLIQF